MRNRIIYIALLIVLATIGCNETPYLDLPEPDDMIVIDGWIENGEYSKVLLTRNAPYFSSLDSTSIRELVLTRAKVTISDGERSEIMILRKNEEYFPPYVYESNEIMGETGKSYTITAEFGGRKAFAVTTIPPPVGLDTLYFVLNEDSDSLGIIYAEFTDPPETKNYYRILSRISGKDRRYYSSMIMGLDDMFFSGQKFGFSIYRGQKSYLTGNKDRFFTLGDTVSVKFCTIDKEHYEFWNSFQDEVLNTGNPFASSLSQIKSNIQGDGLGIWGGYGVSEYTIILK